MCGSCGLHGRSGRGCGGWVRTGGGGGGCDGVQSAGLNALSVPAAASEAATRFGHPKAPDLVNGGEAQIVEIGYRRVKFRQGGREFGLALTDPQLRHLDHAYCFSVHFAQGRTARAAITVLDAGGMVDRELFHVELSRVSEEFLLLTDDRDALIESLQAYDRGEDGALEALGIDLSETPGT